jgi:hypothetical protein
LKLRSGFGLNELLGATLRSPIVELEDDALRDIKLDPAAALNPVPTRQHGTRLANFVCPGLAIEQQWAAGAPVVINDREVSASIL